MSDRKRASDSALPCPSAKDARTESSQTSDTSDKHEAAAAGAISMGQRGRSPLGGQRGRSPLFCTDELWSVCRFLQRIGEASVVARTCRAWRSAVYGMPPLDLIYSTDTIISVAEMAANALGRHVGQLGEARYGRRWMLHRDAIFILSLPHVRCPPRIMAGVNEHSLGSFYFSSSIRHLYLNFHSSDNDYIQHALRKIGHMTNLIHLSLDLSQFANVFVDLTPLTCLEALRELDIVLATFDIRLCRLLRSLTQPQLRLDLETKYGNPYPTSFKILEDNMLALLDRPSQLPFVSVTRKQNIVLTPRLEERIAQWTSVQELRVCLTDTPQLECLRDHTQLNTLFIESDYLRLRTHKTDCPYACLPTLDALHSCSQLTSLTLSRCRVNENALSGLFSHLKHLSYLKLSMLAGFYSFKCLDSFPSPLLMEHLEIAAQWLYARNPNSPATCTFPLTEFTHLRRFRNLTYLSAVSCFQRNDHDVLYIQARTLLPCLCRIYF